jgi:hypothetical protein
MARMSAPHADGHEDGAQVPISIKSASQRRTSIRDSTPRIQRLHRGEGFEGNIVGEHSRKMDTSALYEVSSGGEHGNTAVLEFGRTEPSKGGIGSQIGKSQRIKCLPRSSGSRHALEGDGKSRVGGSLQGQTNKPIRKVRYCCCCCCCCCKYVSNTISK